MKDNTTIERILDEDGARREFGNLVSEFQPTGRLSMTPNDDDTYTVTRKPQWMLDLQRLRGDVLDQLIESIQDRPNLMVSYRVDGDLTFHGGYTQSVIPDLFGFHCSTKYRVKSIGTRVMGQVIQWNGPEDGNWRDTSFFEQVIIVLGYV